MLRFGHTDVLWHRPHGGLGGVVEFELAIQAGRLDGRSSGWQAEVGEERVNGRGLCEGRDELQMT